ncbi:hypothetical protein B7494_g5578 [Chlorociboria aeruginascens]|nr:hypothetical protein B7494_g5578 [Chlorociboria aeruginascens]
MTSISQEKPSLGSVLVVGGCGFLGHHIVALLSSSTHSSISVVDLRTTRNRHSSPSIQYFEGDITSLSSLLPIFETAKPDVVIHTASPTLTGGSTAIFQKVNVEGTRCVIRACQQTGVQALVYTSSASIISDNVSDLINADERWPVIPASAQTEYYSQTKAEAESLVLSANRSLEAPKLLTAALRPSGIFGPGDVQQIPNILNAYYTNKTGFQLGDNTNLFDFTYVENVAHAHILCAQGLLYTSKLSTSPLTHERIDGEAFFITNDAPVPFWDYCRMLWKAAGSDKGTDHVWVISKDVGLAIGGLLEWMMWAMGRTPKLTRRQVKYSCMTRYYDIGKAKKRLGYAPVVGLEEGIRRSVKWFTEERRREGEKKDL